MTVRVAVIVRVMGYSKSGVRVAVTVRVTVNTISLTGVVDWAASA